MDRFLHLNVPNLSCKSFRIHLAICWLIGFLGGMYLSLLSGIMLSSTIRAVLLADMSILGLLLVILLPFVLSYLAIFLGRPSLVLAVAFSRAFLFAFSGLGIALAFDSARWILASLLMFSDAASVPVLWLFWLRTIPFKRQNVLNSAIVSASVTVLLGCLDYFFASPFMANLLSFQKG